MTDPHKALILNVDDTDAARYAKTRILTRAGFTVIEAASGGEALEKAAANAPDLVLLDVKLPDINGFEVCQRLKQAPATQMILVLQTSASYIGSADKIRALDGGADNYLVAPIEPEEMVANVKALLRLGRVERELREVDRRKDEFLAVLAHELRNPLGPIRNGIELLRRLDPDVPPLQEDTRAMILRQTEHMVRLVDDLLDVSRITQGKINLHLETVDLAAVIHAATETASPMIESRQHCVTVHLPEEPVGVRGDKVRLAQIIGNLLHNAAKFTPPFGQLSVSAAREGDGVLIEVKDNGIGISPQHADSIFELFSQADHAADRVQDGLGIGLALVKTLVELHGGSVLARSAGIGCGSAFEIRLPALAPEPAAASKLCPENAAQEETVRRQVLVVDDNTDAAELLSAMLELDGHQVRTCFNGTDGIASAGRFSPEVVILDIGLPDMTGFEVAARLRQLPGMENAVLIALSGFGQEKDRQLAHEAGFDRHLTKPVSFETLVRTIKELAVRRSPGEAG